MTLIDKKLLNKILYHVEKPGRYVGGEHNMVLKDWHSVDTRVALAFPDIYDLGQANLGLSILYELINDRPDLLAERVFSPWHDMDTAMREKKIPLFSLESKTPINDFNILGITLPYESIYTNVLNLLDLSGIPIRSTQRNTNHPLVIAGGQACFNPEPMADFIDAFAIGDGEELIFEIIHAYQEWESQNSEKKTLLKKLAEISGVYVPSLYEVEYFDDGRIKRVFPVTDDVPNIILKRISPALPPPIKKQIVPNIQVVHDRIAVEIMRGCTRGCRFCHAGIVNRPVRQRNPEDILEAIELGVKATGYEELSLLSLSSSDHTQILDITKAVYEQNKSRRLSVSLPSLRIESFSVDLMDELKDLRPGGGFTIAPEAATDRMRAVINKPLDDEILFETVETIFSHGWLNLKMYYMIGLPGERMEDVEAILDTTRKVQKIGRRLHGNRIRVHVSIGTFIPKPHTPFQWANSEDPESVQKKIDFLREGMRQSKIKLSYNRPDSTLLEAWLSRGDRRLGQVIEQAWQNGAKFDAWDERFQKDFWYKAFDETGIKPDFYINRLRDLDEVFPWDHISTGVSKDFLLEEYEMSQRGETRYDCRKGCHVCGILDCFSDIRPNQNNTYWGCP